MYFNLEKNNDKDLEKKRRDLKFNLKKVNLQKVVMNLI